MQSVNSTSPPLRESTIRIHHVDGSFNVLRFDSATTVEDLVNVSTQRLQASESRPFRRLFSLRLADGWLPNATQASEARQLLLDNSLGCKIELRIRLIPTDLRTICELDRPTIDYLYSQMRLDYVDGRCGSEMEFDGGVELCCLQLRRYFVDMPHRALTRPSNFDYLERQIGLDRFFPPNFVGRAKEQRKAVQQRFGEVAELDECTTMLSFIERIRRHYDYDVEEHRCQVGLSAPIPVRLSISPRNGVVCCRTAFAGSSRLLCTLEELVDVRLIDRPERHLVIVQLLGDDEQPLTLRFASSVEAIAVSDLLISWSALLGVRQQTQENDHPNSAQLIEPEYSLPDDAICSLARDDIKLLERIGQGQFASVFAATLHGRAIASTMLRSAAVKLCSNNDDDDARFKQLLDEALLMSTLDHAHIVRLVGISLSDADGGGGGIWLVMRRCAIGDVRSYMQRAVHIGEALSLRRRLLYAEQLASALVYLEQRQIVHRDIAARNLLLDDATCLLLSDFGLAKHLKRERHHDDGGGGLRANPRPKLPIKWMAPEAISFRRCSASSDVWMSAVAIWELVGQCSRKPFEGVANRDVAPLLERGDRLRSPAGDDCPPMLFALMQRCWAYEPDERPTAMELRERLLAIADNIGEDTAVSNRSSSTTTTSDTSSDTTLPRIRRENDADLRRSSASAQEIIVRLRNELLAQRLDEQMRQVEADQQWLDARLNGADDSNGGASTTGTLHDCSAILQAALHLAELCERNANNCQLVDAVKQLGAAVRRLSVSCDELLADEKRRTTYEFHTRVSEAQRQMCGRMMPIVGALRLLLDDEVEAREQLLDGARLVAIDGKALSDLVR